MSTMSTIASSPLMSLAATKVCPTPPPGAQAPVDQIQGYVMWGVIILFGFGVLLGIGAIVAGRLFGMQHASKAGVISIVVVFAAIIGYFVLPGIVSSMVGDGCIGDDAKNPKKSSSAAMVIDQPVAQTGTGAALVWTVQ